MTSLPWDRLSILHPGLSRKGPRFGVRVQGLRSWDWDLAEGFRVWGLRFQGFRLGQRARRFDEKMHFPCKLLRVFRVKHEGFGVVSEFAI